MDNGAVLLDAYRTIAKAISEGHAITLAAQLLIDNYHVVERQIRDIRFDLPPGYYRQLPKLAEGPFAAYPRVLGVAWAFVKSGSENLTEYLFNKKEIQHLFCKTCGVESFAYGTMPNGDQMAAINVNCLVDVDPRALSPKQVDGKSM